MSSARDRVRRAAGRQALRERLARLGRSTAQGGEARDITKDADRAEPSLEALERRIERLESQLEGLQDAVHRESTRQNKLIEQLLRETRPEAISRSLGEDARRRGL